MKKKRFYYRKTQDSTFLAQVGMGLIISVVFISMLHHPFCLWVCSHVPPSSETSFFSLKSETQSKSWLSLTSWVNNHSVLLFVSGTVLNSSSDKCHDNSKGATTILMPFVWLRTRMLKEVRAPTQQSICKRPTWDLNTLLHQGDFYLSPSTETTFLTHCTQYSSQAS